MIFDNAPANPIKAPIKIDFLPCRAKNLTEFEINVMLV